MFIKHMAPGQLQCLLPIGHTHLLKRFSTKHGGGLIKTLSFIMTSVSKLQRVVSASFRKLF